MSDRYYYTILGKEFGPVSAAEIQKLVSLGKLSPVDLIRDAAGTSRAVATVTAENRSQPAAPSRGQEPPAGAPESSEAVSTSGVGGAPGHGSNVDMQRLFVECLERRKAHRPPPKPVRVRPEGPGLGTRLSSMLGSTLGPLAAFVADWGRSAIDGLAALLVWMIRSKVVWGTVVLVTVVAVGPSVAVRVVEMLTTQDELHGRVKGVYSAIREARVNGTESETWHKARQQSEETLHSIVPLLTRRAQTADPASMALLWLARDDLPRLIAAGETPPAELERRIQNHFRIIEKGFDRR